MDNIISALGTLGAYFAILLVVAVSVETILDPFTALFGSLRKKINPEDLMKDLKEWLPPGSTGQQLAQTVIETTEEAEKGIKATAEVAEAVETAAQAFPVTDEMRKKLLTNLQAIRSKYTADEQRRIVTLRFISAVIGVAIALLLQIDTFALLASLLPPAALPILTTPLAHIGGIVLTGLAASAGSSFWHDQLGKVRALKEASQQVQTATNQ